MSAHPGLAQACFLIAVKTLTLGQGLILTQPVAKVVRTLRLAPCNPNVTEAQRSATELLRGLSRSPLQHVECLFSMGFGASSPTGSHSLGEGPGEAALAPSSQLTQTHSQVLEPELWKLCLLFGRGLSRVGMKWVSGYEPGPLRCRGRALGPGPGPKQGV